MKTISIFNQKGGVGKTTLTLSIGTKFFRDGYKTLFVDMDTQMNLSSGLFVDCEHLTSYDVLCEPYRIKETIIHTEHGDVIPGSLHLATYRGNITALAQAIPKVASDYDIALIDNSPSLLDVSLNSLMAADYILIPMHADIHGYYGLDQTMETVHAVQKRNKKLKVLGIVFNEYRKANITIKCEDLIRESAEKYGVRVFDTKVRNCIKFPEAIFRSEPDIFKYAKSSNAAADITTLVEEIKGALK